MFSLKKTFIPGLVAGLVMMPAWAQEGSAAQQIEALTTEMAVLTAQLKKLEIEASIAQKQNDLTTLRAGPTTANAVASPPTVTTPPTIQSIEGVDDKLYATVVFRDGTTQVVRKNEVIKDGWKVTGLAATAVTLARGGEKVTIGFGFPQQQQQPAFTAPLGRPLAPPGL